VTTKRFQDELEAATFANQFIESVYDSVKGTHKNFEIQIRGLAKNNYVTDGRVVSLWSDDKVIAVANILRTNFNFSQVICTDLTK